MKCDKCNKQATIHLTEVRAGKHVEIHLCEQCAAQAEIPVSKAHNIPLNELLTISSPPTAAASRSGRGMPAVRLNLGGIPPGGLLGCEHDYGFLTRI